MNGVHEPSESTGRAARLPARLAAAALVLLGAAGMRADPAPDQPNAVLQQFRGSLWAVPVYAEFELRQMPRRGDVHVYRGRFWGGRDPGGPATRIEVDVGAGGFTHRILVQGGPDGSVWVSDGGRPAARDDSPTRAALAPGTEMTAFEVIPMPYLYWLDVKLVGTERIRGRAAFDYLFTPPAEFSARNPSVTGVHAYLDAQYDALIESRTLGPAGHVAKTLSLLELRKVGDRWIPKDVDVRNERTRDKTRLSLTAVSAGFPLDPRAFDPAGLAAGVDAPPLARVMRLDP